MNYELKKEGEEEMASVTLGYAGANRAEFIVRDLQNDFNEDNYIRLICSDELISDGEEAPDNILGELEAPPSGSWVAAEIYAGGLKSDTAYTLYFYAQVANGSYYYIDSYTFRTLLSDLEVSVRCDSQTAVVEVKTPDYFSDGRVPAEMYYDSDKSYAYFVDWQNMTQDGDYWIYRGILAYASNADGDTIELIHGYEHTLIVEKIPEFFEAYGDIELYFELMPPLEFASMQTIKTKAVGNSITVTLSEHETYGFPDVYVVSLFYESNTEVSQTKTVTEPSEVVFSDLGDGKWKVYVNAFVGSKQPCVFNDDYSGTVAEIFKSTLTIKSAKAWEWSWTAEEYNALINKGAVSVLTCRRMNEFKEAVKLMISEKLSTSPDYDTYIQRADKFDFSDTGTLTAEKFNGIRFCIGSVRATGITDKAKGEVVLGEYFITLAEKLNEIE